MLLPHRVRAPFELSFGEAARSVVSRVDLRNNCAHSNQYMHRTQGDGGLIFRLDGDLTHNPYCDMHQIFKLHVYQSINRYNTPTLKTQATVETV